MTTKDNSGSGKVPVIAMDAMGGDLAPRETVLGAVEAAGPDLKVILTGRSGEIEEHLAGAGNREYIEVVEATDVIGFDEEPAKAVRSKKDSSLVRAFGEVAAGRADGIVSAGNTGATMTAALMKLRRIKGLKRPGLCVVLPTPEGPTVFIDVGANSEVKPAHLLEFANMASIFSHEVFDRKNPSVGLVSIGEEAIKGNEVVQEAHRLLDASPNLNFYGNVEGRDIVRNVVDVVVTDGFTGNVCLKLMESTSALIIEQVRKVAKSSFSSMLGGLLLKRGMREFKASIDPEIFSGAYLLGVRGLVVVCHGNSSSRAIANAIRIAARAVEHAMVDKIADRIASIQADAVRFEK